ncbi:MAG: hypothetical protein V4549_05665 [Bacteroidota bacterium]
MIHTTTIPVTRRTALEVNGLLPGFLFLFDFIIKSVEMDIYTIICGNRE